MSLRSKILSKVKSVKESATPKGDSVQVVDKLLLRFLDCEDKPIQRWPDSYKCAGRDGWLARGVFHESVAWGVQPLIGNAGRLHIWTPDVTWPGTSDLVFDYHHPGGATLAALEWEGEGEPMWWSRCHQTGRRRYYKSDGTFREETQE